MDTKKKKPQKTTNENDDESGENINVVEIPQVQILSPEVSQTDDEEHTNKPAWKIIRDKALGFSTARKVNFKNKKRKDSLDQVESIQKNTSGSLSGTSQYSKVSTPSASSNSAASSKLHSYQSKQSSSSRLPIKKLRTHSSNELIEIVEETMEIDEEEELHFCQKTTQRQIYIVFAAFVAALSVGITLGYSAILISDLKEEHVEFEVNTKTSTWLGSSCTITMAPGAIVTGIISDKIGRKTLCLLAAIPFLVSFLLIPSTNIFGWMIFGRCLGGVSIGILSAISPTYIGEISHPKLRGIFMRCVSSAVSVGILCVHFLADHIGWRVASYISAFAPLIHFILFLYCPESPMWLIKQKKYAKGKSAFFWLRGETVKSEIELNNLIKEFSVLEFNQSTVSNHIGTVILLPEVWKPTATVMFCFLVVQSSGYIVFAFYSFDVIRESVGKDFQASGIILAIDITRLVMSVVGFLAFDFLNRKFLVAIGGVTTGFSLFGLSIHICYIKERCKSCYYLIPLVLSACFMASVSTFLVSLPWVLCGEIIPLKARDFCVGLCTAFGLSCYFIVVHSNLFIVENYGKCVMCSISGFSVCIGTIILYFIIPESKGNTLSQIEEFYVSNKS